MALQCENEINEVKYTAHYLYLRPSLVFVKIYLKIKVCIMLF